MKKVLLSVDEKNYECLVPDVVSNNLFDYIDDFYNYLDNFKLIKHDDGRYEFTDNEVEGFIHWLNRMFKEQSSVIKEVKDTSIEDLPSWNF